MAQSAEFSAMLNRVPGETNVLVMVDAERLLSSEMSVSAGWRKKLAEQTEIRPLLLPVSAKKLVRAIRIDLESRQQSSEITLLDIPKGPTLKRIGEKHQGYVEKVANTESVWLPQGAYGVKLGSDLYGFLFPANRQDLSNWLRNRSGKVSTYLLQASTAMKSKGPQIVLALDLEDAVSLETLPAKLKELEAISKSEVDVAAISKVIATLRGVKFAVQFEKNAVGTLTVDFDLDTAPLQSVAKGLVLEVLASKGLSIDEMDSWKPAVTGKTVSLSGELGDSGLMRLSSLLELPADLIDDPEKSTEADNPKLYATQAHYKAVQKLTDDLFGKKWQTFGQYAQWAEQYAKKIDRLPLLNVDEEMQQYSARVADTLRDGAVAMKGVGIRTAGRQAQVWNNGGVNYDYYGNRSYGVSNAGDQERRGIRGSEEAQGATDAVSMKQIIEQSTADIRKKMVKKFNVEF
ncbi:MAG: hypothetical protein NT069_15580 [Planctomycetota bacterium]|nr:hypothetical protein [Planctomycetota bacterium]